MFNFWLAKEMVETRPIPGFNAIPIKCSRNFPGKVLRNFGGIWKLCELLERASGVGKIMFLKCFDCRTCFRFLENGLPEKPTYFLRQTFTELCDGNIESFLSYFLLQSVDDMLQILQPSFSDFQGYVNILFFIVIVFAFREWCILNNGITTYLFIKIRSSKLPPSTKKIKKNIMNVRTRRKNLPRRTNCKKNHYRLLLSVNNNQKVEYFSQFMRCLVST